MSTTRPGGRLVKPAGADLTTKQYYVVKTVSGKAQLSSAGTDVHDGVLQNAPALNENSEILGRGAQDTGKVICGGTVTPRAKLTSDANGKAVVATTNDEVFGVALNDVNAAANEIIEYRPSDNKA